jgi:hypothetical protein
MITTAVPPSLSSCDTNVNKNECTPALIQKPSSSHTVSTIPKQRSRSSFSIASAPGASGASDGSSVAFTGKQVKSTCNNIDALMIDENHASTSKSISCKSQIQHPVIWQAVSSSTNSLKSKKRVNKPSNVPQESIDDVEIDVYAYGNSFDT